MATDARREFIDALLAGDDEKAYSFIHPDCVTKHPPTLPYGGVIHGREGYRKLNEDLQGHFEMDLEKVDILEVEGDRLLVVFYATFINRVTRNSTTMTVAEIYRFEDGLCVEQDNYYKTPEHVTALIREAEAQAGASA